MGPFALKLLKWLDIAGLGYRQVIQDNPAKGPKGKNPWIELDGKPIDDTDIIIDLLASKTGFDIDACPVDTLNYDKIPRVRTAYCCWFRDHEGAFERSAMQRDS